MINKSSNKNLYQLFKSRFPKDLSSDFLVHDRGVTSFWKLDNDSARFSAILKKQGVTKGDRVVVQVEKSPENVMLHLACLRAGAIYVPLNTAYTIPEIKYFINDAQPRLIVCDPKSEASIINDICTSKKSPSVLTLDNKGVGSIMDHLLSIDADPSIEPVNDDDLAAILYTSGTTGLSKGAMISHKNLISNALVLHQYWQWQADDVLLHALPIFHIHGLFVALHCALLNASKVLFHARFNTHKIIEDLPNATVMMGVPTFYTRLLSSQAFTHKTSQNMRLFISGSAPLLAESFNAFEERSGHKILERYGMTEAGMITSNPYIGERIAGTVGFALPSVKARVVADTDATDEAKEVPRGDVGILEITGPNVFLGYWQMPEKTTAEFREDGYFITGDMATMDAEGRISIVGRSKDLVISGGFNIYPKEIENLIDKVPEVIESAVIGVAHSDFGEGLTAVVVIDKESRLSEATLKHYLSDKLAKFKQPKKIFFVPELPRNVMGKVQKKELREVYADIYT